MRDALAVFNVTNFPPVDGFDRTFSSPVHLGMPLRKTPRNAEKLR